MPMIPSPSAAIVYGALKLAGYGLYSIPVANALDQRKRPILFALAKVALGLASSLLLIALLSRLQAPVIGDLALWGLMFPLRFLIWWLVLRLFFDFRGRSRVLLLAALGGTVLSYALDGVVWMLFRIVPGMQIPMC